MKSGARKEKGGAMPGAGRKPDPVPTKEYSWRGTVDQHEMMKALGGSPWLQGLLNLEIQRLSAATPPKAAHAWPGSPDKP